MTDENIKNRSAENSQVEWVIPDEYGHPIEPTQLMNTLVQLACEKKTGGLCLILPFADGADQLAAVTSSIIKMQLDWEAMAKSHEERTFVCGQRVKTIPDGFVYEVLGRASEKIGSHNIEGYWLQRLDNKNGSSGGRFLIKKSDYQKLEITKAKRPIGRDRSKWTQPSLTPIDKLSGTKTYGNLSLLRNRVIFIGTKSEFESNLHSIQIALPQQPDQNDWPDLSNWVAWGGVDEDGTAYIESVGNAIGDPLVAVTRDIQALRKVSNKADHGTLTFVTRSIDHILRNFEIVSRISERHRFLLISSGRDRDKTAKFLEDGWQVLELSPDEIIGSKENIRPKLQNLKKNFDAAKAEKSLTLHFCSISDQVLRKCRDILGLLGQKIQECEDGENLNNEIDNFIVTIWKLFISFASWLKFPTGEALIKQIEKIKQLEDQKKYMSVFIDSEMIELIDATIKLLYEFLEGAKFSSETIKAKALFNAISIGNPDRLIVGNNDDVSIIKEWLNDRNINIKIEKSDACEVIPNQVVVAISLFRQSDFQKFIDPVPASIIYIAGYDFECEAYRSRLLLRSKQRNDIRLKYNSNVGLDDIKSKIITDLPNTKIDDKKIINELKKYESGRRPPKITLPKPVDAGENTKEGRLCLFEGCSWAIFTEGHSLSAAISGSENYVERKTVNELVPGDRLIIREAGQKDAIRLVAEDKLGIHEYEKLWQTSKRWREALIDISSDPTYLWHKLSENGLHRERLTVRGWLLDDATIGPRNRHDLSVIAELAGHDPESHDWEECWTAINRLRGLHSYAGILLGKFLDDETRGLHAGSLDQEMAIELTLGTVWLVQIREIQAPAHWPENLVNHLNWGNENWQNRILDRSLIGGS